MFLICTFIYIYIRSCQCILSIDRNYILQLHSYQYSYKSTCPYIPIIDVITNNEDITDMLEKDLNHIIHYWNSLFYSSLSSYVILRKPLRHGTNVSKQNSTSFANFASYFNLQLETCVQIFDISF